MVRPEQPFQFTHAIIEWDFLTCLTSTVPTGFVRTSRGLLPCTWGWDISVVWSVNPEFLHLYQTVWKTTTPHTSGSKIVFAFWSLLNPYKEDRGSSGCTSSACFRRASPHPRGTWYCPLSESGFWASWTSGLQFGVATLTFQYMPHI